MNSRVRVLDLDTGGKKELYTLVFPEHADMSAKRSPSWHRWEIALLAARKLHGKSGHSYNSVETHMNLRASSVLYLADGTSINTISTANTKLAMSENTACNGFRWK